MTIITSGDYKIHTFNSSGTFTIICGKYCRRGCWCILCSCSWRRWRRKSKSWRWRCRCWIGGYREGKNSGDPYSASPLNAPAGLTSHLILSRYCWLVDQQTSPGNQGEMVVNSIKITSAGGGGGGLWTNLQVMVDQAVLVVALSPSTRPAGTVIHLLYLHLKVILVAQAEQVARYHLVVAVVLLLLALLLTVALVVLVVMVVLQVLVVLP